MIPDILRRASKSYVFNSIFAVGIVIVVASVVNLPTVQARWGKVNYFSADWYSDEGMVEFNMSFTKNQACYRTIVNKLVRRVGGGGDIVPDPVAAVNGRLGTEIQKILVGATRHIRDKARLVSPSAKDPSTAPPVILPEGQYMVTFIGLCELPDAAGQLVSTETVQSILIIPPAGRP